MTDTLHAEILALKRARPKATFLKCSLLFAGLYLVFVWNAHFILGERANGLFPTFTMQQSSFAEYGERIGRFFIEILPYPVRQDGPLLETVDWAWSLLSDHALEAAAVTICIALLSALIAAGLGFTGALLQMGARIHTQQHHFPDRSTDRIWLKRLFGILSRIWSAILVVTRAVPELIWAFIILSILGPTPWTAIAALAVHNTGILGRLGNEIIRDARYPSLDPLQNSGTRSSHLVLFSILPAVFQKFLIHGFYRWETCLRDAVIVGMIGLPTLGFWIFQEAWPKFRYDEMMLYIILSLALVLAIESLSQLTRRFLNLRLETNPTIIHKD